MERVSVRAIRASILFAARCRGTHHEVTRVREGATSTTTPLAGRQDENRVDVDQLFGALSHPTRRRILVSLVEDDARGREEFESTEFVPDGPDRESSTVSLRHTHLPHLDDAGFVGWDPESERITRGANFEDVRPLLELMDAHREELPDDWP